MRPQAGVHGAGCELLNPFTGERINWIETTADSRGKRLRFELVIPPDTAVPAPHVHPVAPESFEVLSGQIGLRVGKERSILGYGRVTVPPGVPHSWWNAGDSEARALVEFLPAHGFEGLFRSGFAYMEAGATSRRGTPPLLAGAVLLDEFRNEFEPLPRPLARLVRALAPIGRFRGHRVPYPRSWVEKLNHPGESGGSIS